MFPCQCVFPRHHTSRMYFNFETIAIMPSQPVHIQTARTTPRDTVIISNTFSLEIIDALHYVHYLSTIERLSTLQR